MANSGARITTRRSCANRNSSPPIQLQVVTPLDVHRTRASTSTDRGANSGTLATASDRAN
jgi:hypothetical protein